MQLTGTGKTPPGVLFDTDLANRIDSLLALALLYGLDGKGEARVACVSISEPNLRAAALADVIARLYAGPQNPFARSLPVGLCVEGKERDGQQPMLRVLDLKNEKGEPQYPHSVNRVLDTAEVAPLLRNALTAYVDAGTVVVCAGPATNLASLLALPGAKDWITRKCRYLVWSYDDARISADVKAARRVAAEWPTPIVAAGPEASAGLVFPGDAIETAFKWSEHHPVADAYRAAGKMPYDAPAGDLAPVWHAVRPESAFFKLGEPGTISVGDDGKARFQAGGKAAHRPLILDASQKDKLTTEMVELVSAKPVPRFPRFRQQQQQQQAPPAEQKKKQ